MDDSKPPTWTDTQQSIAFVIIGSTIVIILIWLFRPPTGTEGAMAVLNNLMGALLAAFGMVVAFYFGSSKGSKDKDEANTKMVAALTGTGNGTTAVADAAAVKAAPAAAAVAAPPAAAEAAPPAAEIAAPAAAEVAVEKALKEREHSQPKE